MSNDGWFDTLAKDSAQGLSRRQLLGRLLGGTGAAVLGLFGMRAAAAKDCGKLCQVCCENQFSDHGVEYGRCVSDCHKGQGVCGPIVCPGG